MTMPLPVQQRLDDGAGMDADGRKTATLDADSATAEIPRWTKSVGPEKMRAIDEWTSPSSVD